LSEEPIRGKYSPGAGGWPTIRYFNKETGPDGKPYAKKTSDAMCTELGNDDYMQAYIQEAGGTSLCSIAEGYPGCNDKEKQFIAKWKDSDGSKIQEQTARLSKMKGDGNKMKADLKKWITQRLAILKQISGHGGQKQEL